MPRATKAAADDTLRARPGARSDRRVHIADAAITVLAADGSRGLTHRAVDRQLGLAAGSTSYYFRTRESLLAAANERLAELDAADLAGVAATPEGIGKLLDRWLAPANRERLFARFELYLGAARTPGRPLAATRRRFVERTEGAMRGAGLKEPALAALALVALTDGLIVHSLLGSKVRRADRTRIVRSVLAAFR